MLAILCCGCLPVGLCWRQQLLQLLAATKVELVYVVCVYLWVVHQLICHRGLVECQMDFYPMSMHVPLVAVLCCCACVLL